MSEEWTLSDKIGYYDLDGYFIKNPIEGEILEINEVKEAVRRLKEFIDKDAKTIRDMKLPYNHTLLLLREIDKIFGEELSK